MEPKGRLARWVMHLQEYEFDVVHRAGSENGNADGLSCLTPLYRGTPKVANSAEFSTTCATTINLSCNLHVAEREDPRLKVVIDMHVKSDNLESALPEYSFVIPSHLVPFVLQGIQSSPFAGHLGLKKTPLRTKNCFFWPMMKSDISHFVRSCPDCAQNKLDSSQNTAPLQQSKLVSPSFSGQWIIWAPSLKRLGVTNTCW